MPMQYVEAEIALDFQGIQIYHTYPDDCADWPASEYWFEVGGEHFDIRDYEFPDEIDTVEDQLKDMILSKVGPFTDIKAPKRRKYDVTRLVDAFVVYTQTVEASSPEEAELLARDGPEADWEQSHVNEFDHREYEVDDSDEDCDTD
jgi:hypothetical protein